MPCVSKHRPSAKRGQSMTDASWKPGTEIWQPFGWYSAVWPRPGFFKGLGPFCCCWFQQNFQSRCWAGLGLHEWVIWWDRCCTCWICELSKDREGNASLGGCLKTRAAWKAAECSWGQEDILTLIQYDERAVWLFLMEFHRYKNGPTGIESCFIYLLINHHWNNTLL